MWKTHCGAFMAVEKEATEERMKAAAASRAYPAYRSTGMLRRTLASNQQQKADLWRRLQVSAAVVDGQSWYEKRVPEGCRRAASRVSVLGDQSACAAAGEFLCDVEDGVG